MKASTRFLAAVVRLKGGRTEYLILAAVVAMMTLYALIIIGCLKQPEW